MEYEIDNESEWDEHGDERDAEIGNRAWNELRDRRDLEEGLLQ